MGGWVVLTVPLRYALSQSATKQVASTRAASPRPSLLASNSCPTTQLPQRCPEISAAPTERHPASPLPETATGAHRRACQPNGGEDVSASRATASPTRRSLGRAPAARHRWPRLLTHTAPHRRHTHALGPALEHRVASNALACPVRMSHFFATGRPRPTRSELAQRAQRAGWASPGEGALTARAEISD